MCPDTLYVTELPWEERFQGSMTVLTLWNLGRRIRTEDTGKAAADAIMDLTGCGNILVDPKHREKYVEYESVKAGKDQGQPV